MGARGLAGDGARELRGTLPRDKRPRAIGVVACANNAQTRQLYFLAALSPPISPHPPTLDGRRQRRRRARAV